MAPLSPIADSARFIIVGAGTAGLLLANRLSSDPGHSVVVIEPGPDDRDIPSVTNPFRWLENQNTHIDWAYDTTPQPGAGGRVLRHHAGRIVGGTSTMNGMKYIRADAAQIDAWEALGAVGWNWNTMWPYYKRCEGWVRPTDAENEAGATHVPDFHGNEGEVSVGYSHQLRKKEFYELMAATWEGMGFERRLDANGGSLAGFVVRPWTVDPEQGTRSSAASAFYHPVDGRPNLRFVRGTVNRIVWEDESGGGDTRQRAVGVRYVDESGNEAIIRLTDEGEVILAAGSLRTPPILEASGIGHAGRLEKLGVEVKVDLPGVGENLQEQASVSMSLNGTFDNGGYAPYALWATAKQLFGKDTEYIAESTRANLPDWARKIAGTDSGIGTEAVEKILAVQHDLIFGKNITIAEIVTTDSGDTLSMETWALQTFSRGSVHPRSAAVGDIDKPLIDPRFFQIDFDLDCSVATGRLGRGFWTKEPVKSMVRSFLRPDEETLPPVDATQEQWECVVRKTFAANNHPVGTAAMMSRELGGVVSPELRVYGTANVRVADASVMPLQVSGHLVATVYAIAERAAEFILGRASVPSG